MAKKKKKGISINLSEVSTGGKTLPEGRYQVKVKEVEVKTSHSGNEFLAFTFEVVEGKHKKAKIFHNCSLQPQALFNLKTVLEALEYDIPEGFFDLDIEELVDLECILEGEHETYEGKKKFRVVDFDTVGESDEEEEEEEEDEEEEEEEEDEEDLSELSLKELKAKARELGIKVPKKADKDDLIELIEEALEEEEDEEEDEEDEEEIDYSELSLKELKSLAKERGIKVKKGMDEEDIIELLEEDDEE